MSNRDQNTGILQVVSLIVCMALPMLSALAEEEVEKLSLAQWNVPRSAEVIIGMAPVRNTIQKYQNREGARIRIHYTGGDEGSLWVTELRSWLVSLGIPSRHIEMIPGAADPAQLELAVYIPIKTSDDLRSVTRPHE